MIRKGRRERRVPQLNTASLPDLIFTVLFFFMIVTHMRDVEVKVEYEVPKGTEIEKLTKRTTISHIYIGKLPENGETAIQINDKLASLDEIGEYVTEERSHLSPEDLKRMAVSIDADKDVRMGLISDVKQELRKVDALKIIYSGEKQKK